MTRTTRARSLVVAAAIAAVGGLGFVSACEDTGGAGTEQEQRQEDGGDEGDNDQQGDQEGEQEGGEDEG